MSRGFARFVHFSFNFSDETQNPMLNNQLAMFSTIRTKHRSAYAELSGLRTITVEQPVDKPFMTGAVAGSACFASVCSFFDQSGMGKTGARSTPLR
jgi:hypothetical protein